MTGILLLTFTRIDVIQVQQEGPLQIAPIHSFKDAGLHPAMVENIILCGYDSPTPIQKYTIPAIVGGHDVIGIAQTGRSDFRAVTAASNHLDRFW